MPVNFSNDIAGYIDRAKAITGALLQEWAGQMEGYAKSHTSWVDRTSHARQSLHGGVDIDGDRYVLYISHGMEYGQYLESGSGPRVIRPVNKKALYWPGAKHPVRQVSHPGSKPYPIVKPTIDSHYPRILRTLLDLWGG